MKKINKKLLNFNFCHKQLLRNSLSSPFKYHHISIKALLCGLDEVTGVDVGKTYRNDKQVVTFSHYIAEASRLCKIRMIDFKL
jgi:hypothetical protein